MQIFELDNELIVIDVNSMISSIALRPADDEAIEMVELSLADANTNSL